MSLLSKERRKLYSRRIKGFWEEFSANKIGLAGLAIVIIYVFLAIFSPWLTPHDPITTRNLADSFAVPGWITIFPQYSNLPPTVPHIISWQIDEIQGSLTHRDVTYGRNVMINYTGKMGETAQLRLATNFTYNYDPPKRFYCKFQWKAQKVENAVYALQLFLVTANGTQYRIWRAAPSEDVGGEYVHRESSHDHTLRGLGLTPGKDNLAQIAFSESGTYELVIQIDLRPLSEGAIAGISIEEGEFWIMGLVHGILGTDHVGGDLFSQLIYGSQISLTLGLSAAILGTAIGILYGVISGYVGGVSDEIMMRIVDVLICLPVLPLLLALTSIYGASVLWIIVLIAIFGWQGLARIIRSQVLSLRETAFVECARASGASKFYIMIRHLVPNVFPIAFASLVLRVPGAILTEATLSFLGFGDPAAPTWGRMLNHAWGHGAFGRLAWWWIIPPGLAITTICLAFVFMGHAIDEVVNPRLRRRR